MTDEGQPPVFDRGPNAICFTCGGFKKVSDPRLYMIQATEDLTTGMTLAEWRGCPQCGGDGILTGIRPPV
ncbi:hypothetical protein SAMN02982929_01717 [Saccharopolyspora kobensis]|uniref:Uncharacterized protein n=1 Tax=Saccharopolyspora kobensis TaxID=146035 RepID=A0A1H5Y225_9PSEU|nr:hypothetical protein [Saccharopolyspora kobensis]SEG17835.1 hypothetical protein SAMN02982929_01717 [Saccharopolyspora kobensis]SFF09502.1 hypothetical protein SAMN05216506_11925 [Saccharopolyspora kobensis]